MLPNRTEKSLVPQATEGIQSLDLESPSTQRLQPEKKTEAVSLTHVNPAGAAHMVNVGSKAETRRAAIAYAWIAFGNEKTFPLVAENKIKKGDVLSVARIAGIMAAKRTSDLIPLCHPINISKVDVELKVLNRGTSRNAYGPVTNHGGVTITAHVECTGQTGVEMEAMTAVTGAALTIYDMCKAVDREMTIGNTKLLYKSGGKSGLYVNHKWLGSVGNKFFLERDLQAPVRKSYHERTRQAKLQINQRKEAHSEHVQPEDLKLQALEQAKELELRESPSMDTVTKELQPQESHSTEIQTKELHAEELEIQKRDATKSQ